MGNTGSHRSKSGSSTETVAQSPKDGQAFTFDKKHPRQLSHEEEEPYFTKPVPSSSVPSEPEFAPTSRQRAATVSEGTKLPRSKLAQVASTENVKAKVYPTVFKWGGGGKNVYISGSFSDWKVLPMVKSHGDFVTIIDLPEGDHQYKFFVDGEWKNDPGHSVINSEIGTKNSIMTVKQCDFEVFQALAKDSEDKEGIKKLEFSQETPTLKPWEKVPPPPVLPPHLLQVILNKDTPVSCEPTLLPEPNHVMLNHLYALSIKDGVMVLSATHRYRKKYVTTLLYKPI